jgi:hypothetical protein
VALLPSIAASLCGEGRNGGSGCNQSRLPSDELCRHRRKAIGLLLRPVIFDNDVLPGHETALAETHAITLSNSRRAFKDVGPSPSRR